MIRGNYIIKKLLVLDILLVLFIPSYYIIIELALKQAGEDCGKCKSCSSAPWAGKCDEGLECVFIPLLEDSTGRCLKKQGKMEPNNSCNISVYYNSKLLKNVLLFKT